MNPAGPVPKYSRKQITAPAIAPPLVTPLSVRASKVNPMVTPAAIPSWRGDKDAALIPNARLEIRSAIANQVERPAGHTCYWDKNQNPPYVGLYIQTTLLFLRVHPTFALYSRAHHPSLWRRCSWSELMASSVWSGYLTFGLIS